jgi:hypothetical protein
VDSNFIVAYVRGEVSPADYWRAARADCLPALDQACQGLQGWAARLASELDEGFRRLQALDRADPLWAGTNQLPTLFKLPALARRELAADPHDVAAAQLLIATDLAGGGSHLDPLAWVALQQAGALDLGFLIGTAWNCSPYATDGYIGQLVVLLRLFNAEGNLQPWLDVVSQLGPDAAEWAAAVEAPTGDDTESDAQRA